MLNMSFEDFCQVAKTIWQKEHGEKTPDGSFFIVRYLQKDISNIAFQFYRWNKRGKIPFSVERVLLKKGIDLGLASINFADGRVLDFNKRLEEIFAAEDKKGKTINDKIQNISLDLLLEYVKNLTKSEEIYFLNDVGKSKYLQEMGLDVSPTLLSHFKKRGVSIKVEKEALTLLIEKGFKTIHNIDLKERLDFIGKRNKASHLKG